MTEATFGIGEITIRAGGVLRAAREERGLTPTDVAQQLKFAPRQIEALEAERFEELPGGTIVRGMVRSYARLLKLDPEPLLADIGGRLAAPDAADLAARYQQPVPFHDSARRSTLTYLALSVVVLGVGGVVALQWYHEPLRIASVAKTTDTTPQEAPMSGPVAAEPKAAEPKAADPAALAAHAADPAPAKAARAEEASSRPASGAVHRLVIYCQEESWIEVKDANERVLVSSLNAKGSERVVEARGPLSVVIGNAEHVKVVHNERRLDLVPHTRLAIARFTLE